MNRWSASLAVLIGASLYGLMAPVIKMAYQAGLSETEVISGQYIVAMAIFLLTLPRVWVPLRQLGAKQWLWLLFVGCWGLGGTSIFYYLALHQLPASLAVVLLFQFAWVVLVMDLIRWRRRPYPYELAALACVVAGTFFSVQVSGVQLSHIPYTGWLFGFIAAVAYASFLYYSADLPKGLSTWGRSAVMTIVAALFVFAFFPPQFLLTGRWLEILPWMVVLGIFCSAAPTLLLVLGTPHIPSAMTGILGSVELPISVIAAAVLLSEPVNLWQWLGIALIVAGIFIVEWYGKDAKSV